MSQLTPKQTPTHAVFAPPAVSSLTSLSCSPFAPRSPDAQLLSMAGGPAAARPGAPQHIKALVKMVDMEPEMERDVIEVAAAAFAEQLVEQDMAMAVRS